MRFKSIFAVLAVLALLGVPVCALCESPEISPPPGSDQQEQQHRGRLMTFLHAINPLSLLRSAYVNSAQVFDLGSDFKLLSHTPGVATAQNNLKFICAKLDAIPKTYLGPAILISSAASQGCGVAQASLELVFSTSAGSHDFDTALDSLKRSATEGDPRAQFLLAEMYESGQGIARDPIAVANWYHRAAAQGVPHAEFALGAMYRRGEGVPRNYFLAFNWLWAAADQGDPAAQQVLGIMYLQGQGVDHDNISAYLYLSLASAADGSTETISELESKMSHADVARAQRLAETWWSTHPILVSSSIP